MANKIVIGVDPDSERFGVAKYINSELSLINNMKLPDLVGLFLDCMQINGQVIASIENVMVNQFVYARNQHSSKSAQSKIAMHIGRCQQAQIELMRWLDHYEIPYALHKPQKGNWADNKELFEKITGWNGKSNQDNRAAAYFGYLALEK